MHTEAIMGISLPIIITLGAFIMVVYLRKYKNIERMAMIDKGLSPDLFKDSESRVTPLRWSLLFVGCGIGLLLGYWLDRTFDMVLHNNIYSICCYNSFPSNNNKPIFI